MVYGADSAGSRLMTAGAGRRVFMSHSISPVLASLPRLPVRVRTVTIRDTGGYLWNQP